MKTVGGSGNLNGDYWKKTEKGWLERVPLQAAWLAEKRRGIGLEWFAATELHAEHNAHKPLEEELGQDWAIIPGPSGNLLIIVRDRVELYKAPETDHYPKKPSRLTAHSRGITKFNVRNPYHPETRYWISIEHFRSGSTPDIEAAKREQAAGGNAFLDPIWRGIRCGDFNSWQSSDDPTTPRGIMRSAGWRSLQHTAKGRYTNADLNTGLRYGHEGRDIEDMLTRERPDGTSLVKVLSAAKWDARPLTDHSAFQTGEFDIADKVLSV